MQNSIVGPDIINIIFYFLNESTQQAHTEDLRLTTLIRDDTINLINVKSICKVQSTNVTFSEHVGSGDVTGEQSIGTQQAHIVQGSTNL